MTNEGWISLYRKFLEWEWYSDLPVRVLFLHCLLKVNHKAKKWMGRTIQPGQFATSLNHLSKETALSQQQCRTALSKLKSTGEITYQSTSQYSIITVNNWKLYQAVQHSKQQTSNKRATTNNNDNKRDINKLISLSIEEREILKKYFLELNENRKNKIEDIDAYIRKLVENGDCLTKLEKAKKKLERQKAKEVIPPPENFEKSTPEEDKAGLELLRETAKQIRKRKTEP